MNDTITQLRAIVTQFTDEITHWEESMAQVTAFRTQSREGRHESRLSAARLTWATVIAALVAVGATVALYFFASAAGFIDQRVVLPSLIGVAPMSLASVSTTAAMATVGAGILLGVLVVSTRRPFSYFRALATALAVLSLAMPATIPGPSLAMRLIMAGMHAIVWVVSLGVLARLVMRPMRDGV